VKKFLVILAFFGLLIFAAGLSSQKTGAKKNIFEKGTQDELERAKQISLNILRGKSAERATGDVADFQVQKVEIDELKMAHTKVRQAIGNIPVWEGEAIVHLNPDGELSTITDDLKQSIAVNTQPNFSAKEADKFALGMYRGKAELI